MCEVFLIQRKGQREKNQSFYCHVRKDLLILYIICTKNFHKVIGVEKKVVYIIGRYSLLIIILEFEVIDMPELNIHQLAALLNLSESVCQIYSRSILLASILACLEVCCLEN